MTLPLDPAVLRDVETLATAGRQLAEALSRLHDASARSSGLVGQTAWCTDAAALFHATAAAWHREIADAAAVVEAASDEVGRARIRRAAGAEAPW